jgi:hypothetical protein
MSVKYSLAHTAFKTLYVPAGRSGVRIRTKVEITKTSYSMRTGAISRGQSCRGVKFNTHLYLVSRLTLRLLMSYIWSTYS